MRVYKKTCQHGVTEESSAAILRCRAGFPGNNMSLQKAYRRQKAQASSVKTLPFSVRSHHKGRRKRKTIMLTWILLPRHREDKWRQKISDK
jgi:hypothetical protein